MEQLTRVTAPTLDVLDVLLAHHDATWGLIVIKESGRAAGTVYPILERLEERGWVTSEWDEDETRPGPRRRLYTLTSDGAVAARELLAQRVARGQRRPAALRPHLAGPLQLVTTNVRWAR